MPIKRKPAKKRVPIKRKPAKIIRDKKTGRIIKGVAQDTNKNGTAGLPTQYDPKYCQQLIDFFSIEAMEIIKDGSFDGKVKRERLPAKMPWFEGFARKIRVSTTTLYNWQKQYPEFAEAYAQAKELQREFLVEVGLSGKASASFVIFTMKNVCGWRDERDLRLKEDKKELSDEELEEALFG